MDFKRSTGFFDSTPRKWIDTNLPKCPGCKCAGPLWENALELKFGLNRYHFRCPRCFLILSIPSASVMGSGGLPSMLLLKQIASKDFRVESTGNNPNCKIAIGNEYPVAILQAEANKP